MKVGGEMNISKYIELLRFYLLEKLDEIDNSLETTVSDELNDITQSVLSALFAMFISNESIQTDGICGVLLKVGAVIGLYFLFKFIFKKFARFRKTKTEVKKSDEKELTTKETKNLVDKFDHITCDGMLLSIDFISKYKDESINKNEREFYLIEAFYYYKKSSIVAELIVKHAGNCVNSPSKSNGVSIYRLINVYNALDELHKEIKKLVKDSCIANKEEFITDIDNVENRELRALSDYISGI